MAFEGSAPTSALGPATSRLLDALRPTPWKHWQELATRARERTPKRREFAPRPPLANSDNSHQSAPYDAALLRPARSGNLDERAGAARPAPGHARRQRQNVRMFVVLLARQPEPGKVRWSAVDIVHLRAAQKPARFNLSSRI